MKMLQRIKRGPENGVSKLTGNERFESVVYCGIEHGLLLACIYEMLILSIVFRHDTSVRSLSLT